MPRLLLLLLTSWLLVTSAFAQKTLALRSPNGQLTYRFRLTPQAPVYAVAFGGQPVIAESTLGLVFEQGGAWGAGLRQLSAQQTSVDEYYTLLVGKASRVRNHYRQVVIALQEIAGPRRLVNRWYAPTTTGWHFATSFPGRKTGPATC